MIYDGEYAKIKLKKFWHGDKYGEVGYHFDMELENKMDEPIQIYFGNIFTTINKHQVKAYYYEDEAVGPGDIGDCDIHIYDEDIPDNIGVIKEINTKLCINYDGVGEDSFFQIPMVIDVNAAE